MQIPKESQNDFSSFLELKSTSEVKAKADPMLKSMLFGFPNPRKKSFGGS